MYRLNACWSKITFICLSNWEQRRRKERPPPPLSSSNNFTIILFLSFISSSSSSSFYVSSVYRRRRCCYCCHCLLLQLCDEIELVIYVRIGSVIYAFMSTSCRVQYFQLRIYDKKHNLKKKKLVQLKHCQF